jgi:hypothetical protein
MSSAANTTENPSIMSAIADDLVRFQRSMHPIVKSATGIAVKKSHTYDKVFSLFPLNCYSHPNRTFRSLYLRHLVGLLDIKSRSCVDELLVVRSVRGRKPYPCDWHRWRCRTVRVWTRRPRICDRPQAHDRVSVHDLLRRHDYGAQGVC